MNSQAIIQVNWLDSDYTTTGTGIVQIVDSRMNFHHETVENFDVYVWSDSDPEGIEIVVTETGENTDTFDHATNLSFLRRRKNVVRRAAHIR